MRGDLGSGASLTFSFARSNMVDLMSLTKGDVSAPQWWTQAAGDYLLRLRRTHTAHNVGFATRALPCKIKLPAREIQGRR